MKSLVSLEVIDGLQGGMPPLPVDVETAVEPDECLDCEEKPSPVVGEPPTLAPLALTPSQTEDAWLVQECLQGNQQAWERLIDKYKRLIYAVPFKYGAGPEDAADIFQVVCIELVHRLGKLRNVQSLRAWLMTVTMHQSYHWKRKRQCTLELDAMEPEMVAEMAVAPERVSQMHQEQTMREALAQLPPRCGELLRLLFLEQPALPYSEVARRLGLATGSIGFIRGRCLKKLRTILVELGFS